MTCPWTPTKRVRLRAAVSKSRVRGGIPLKTMEALTPSQAVGAAREMLAFLPRLGRAGGTAAVMARSPALEQSTSELVSVALHARQECRTCRAFHEAAAVAQRQ
jgi:AhpD family alkylhydroperoxidase